MRAATGILGRFLWILSLLVAFPAAATTYTWTGTASALWSNTANWSPAGTPGPGDTVVFPTGPTTKALTNDLTGASVATVSFTGSGYAIAGNTLAVTASVTNTGSGNALNLVTDFGANNVSITGGSNGVTFQSIAGSGTVTITNVIYVTGGGSFSGTFTNNPVVGGQALSLQGGSMPNATVGGALAVGGHGTIGAFNSTLYIDPTGTFATGNLRLQNYIYADLDTGDQVQVNGTVTLATGASLQVRAASSFVPVLGQQVTLLANDGSDAIVGTFNGLPEGGIVTVNGADYQLTYHGGDGNDVVITCIAAPRSWTGASSALWSNAANWSPAGVPANGDRLLFAAGASHLANTNDLTGLALQSITVVGNNYAIGGNGLVITSRMTVTSDQVRFTLPVDLQNYNAKLDGGGYGLWLQSLAGTGTVAINGLAMTGAGTFSGTFQAGGISGHGDLNFFDGTLPDAHVGTNIVVNGNGAIADVVATDGLSPDGPLLVPAILTARNVSLQSYLYIDLQGAAPGTGTDQLHVLNSMSYTGGLLRVRAPSGFVPSTGAEYVIVRNDGTSSGTLTGMPEGTIVTVNGTWNFRLTYVGGDGNDLALVAQNGRTPPTVSYDSSANPSSVGGVVKFTVALSGASGTPTGNVTFYDGLTSLGTLALSGGQAQLATSALASGVHDITFEYAGDANYGTMAATLRQYVGVAPTTTAISTSANPAELGSNVTLDVLVTSAAGTPTGTVTLYDGGVALASGAVDGTGHFKFSTSGASRGTHPITASFTGSGTFGSSSGTLSPMLVVQDTTPPTITFTQTPPHLTNSANVQFRWTLSDLSGISKVVCNLGALSLNCSSPFGFGGLADGSYTFVLQVEDSLGNATSASWAFTVDTTAPTLTFNSPRVTLVDRTDVVFAGACEPGNVVRIQVVDASLDFTTACVGLGAPNSGGFYQVVRDVGPLPFGVHAAVISETDSAGNAGSVNGSVEVLAAPLLSQPPRVDFDLDGHEDVSLWNPGTGDSAAWAMNGLRVRDGRVISGGTGSVIHALGRFDGAGSGNDVLWRMPDGSYRISLMSGLVAGPPVQILGAGSGWNVVAVADFDGNGTDDLLFQHSSGAYGVWLMNGTALVAASSVASPGAGFSVVIVADFDRDGQADLLWRHPDGRTAITFLHGTTASAPLALTGTTDWRPRFAADLDGDGYADLLWERPGSQWAAWTMRAGVIQSSAGLTPGASSWRVVLAGDLDGDGKADLVWQNQDGRYAAWLMNGATATAYGMLIDSANSGWTAAALRDLDGDGRKDIVWRHTDGRVAAWLMNGLTLREGAVFLDGGAGWIPYP